MSIRRRGLKTIGKTVTTFLDTSFLIKLYIPEIHSDKAVAIASQLSGSVAVSALTDVEMASALFRRLPGAGNLRQVSP
ncbi:type II toxin-antitoxin system VapC family toxin [Granulicella mallensis]|uniref:type II toxin-antitoxin system VapC family toxin n=1 Tax=Granulicella mallensis TaxID=940614 RepID=UPI0039068741